jgi:hypothetical protein
MQLHDQGRGGRPRVRLPNGAVRHGAGMPVRQWLVMRWWLVFGLLVLGIVPRLVWLDQLWGDDYDLGIYHNLVWNLAEGRGFWSDVLGRSHLGEHASPLVALFVPFYWLSPSAVWLVAAQGVAVAVVAGAAMWFAELRLAAVTDVGRRRWAWIAMLALTLGYAPLWSAWWHDPQPVLWGAAGLAVALVALERRRWWAVWLGLLLLLVSRESAGLAGLGLAWLAWRKASSPRAAVAIAVLSLLWTAVAMLWLMPAMREGMEWGHASRFAPHGLPMEKVLYLARLLGQLALLPLFDPVTALAALPGVLLNLMTGHLPQVSSAYHYDAQIAPFLLLAAAGGLAVWLGRTPGRQPLLVALLAGALLWGACPPARAVCTLWQPARAHGVATTKAELAVVLARIPTGAALAADPQLGPLLCLRQGYHVLRGPGDHGDATWVRALPMGTYLVVQRYWWQEHIVDPPADLQVLHDGRTLVVMRRGP